MKCFEKCKKRYMGHRHIGGWLLSVGVILCIGGWISHTYISADGGAQDDIVTWYQHPDGSTHPQSYIFPVSNNDTQDVVATYSLVTPVAGFSLTPSGNLIGDDTLGLGQYDLEYERCFDVAQTEAPYAVENVCERARVAVSVFPAFQTHPDIFSAIPLSSSGLLFRSNETVLDNDTYLGSALVPSEIVSLAITSSTLTGVTIDMDGHITIPHGSVAGTYVVHYELCYNEPAAAVRFFRMIGIAHAGLVMCSTSQISIRLEDPLVRSDQYIGTTFFELLTYQSLAGYAGSYLDLPDVTTSVVPGYPYVSEAAVDLLDADGPVHLTSSLGSASFVLDIVALGDQNTTIHSQLRSCVSYQGGVTSYCESYDVDHEISHALRAKNFDLQVDINDVIVSQDTHEADPVIDTDWSEAVPIYRETEIVSSDLSSLVSIDNHMLVFQSGASRSVGIYNIEYRTCSYVVFPSDSGSSEMMYRFLIPVARADSSGDRSVLGCVTGYGQLTVGTPRSLPSPVVSGGGGAGGGSSLSIVATPIDTGISSSQAQFSSPAEKKSTPAVVRSSTLGSPESCASPIQNLDDTRLRADIIRSSRLMGVKKHQALTRSQFYTLFSREQGLVHTSSHLHRFSDVRAIDPLYGYISGLVDAGYIRDMQNFRPNALMSRAEAARIFVLAHKKGVVDYDASSFSDVDVGTQSGDYVESAYRQCLLHGRMTQNGDSLLAGKRIFEPLDGITLSEAIKVLKNIQASRGNVIE